MVQEVLQDVLVVTSDCSATRLVLECLASRAVRGTVVRGAKAAEERIEQRPWDLVVLDTEGLDADAFALVDRIRQRSPDLAVVMLSSEPSVRAAVQAMREGCADFLVKPLERPAVEAMLKSLLPAHSVPLAAADEADGRCLLRIAGRSPRLFEAIALAKKVAPTSIPVLITGESGTGKELLSYLIHRAGNRARGPYVRVNCAALSESLLESELFGHERGAFTGAIAQRKGRFERAHGGTLLLDEISETGPRLQAELLRVLEQQDFERVGGSESVSVNVRVISTTNRDLERDVREGRFRADLYYRLCGVRLAVAPLRERREDIPVLAWHFVNQFAREVRRSVAQLDPELVELLLRYDWPGNVRQLRNIVRTALIVGSGPVLSLSGAPWIQAELSAGRPGGVAAAGPRPHSLALRDVEREAILEALRITHSHQAKAARLLGITDRTLREKLRRYRSEGSLDDSANRRHRASESEGARRPRDRVPDPLAPGRTAKNATCEPLWSDVQTPEPGTLGEKPCLIGRI